MSFKKLKFMPMLVIAVVMALACEQKSENSFTISGTADGTVDGDTVHICEIRGNYFDLVPTDTAVVKDGRFEFSGECEGVSMRWLMPVHEGVPTTVTPFILEKGEIKAELGRGEEKSNIEGGPNSKLYAEFEKGTSEIGQQTHEHWRVYSDSTKSVTERETAQAKIDSLNGEMLNYSKKFILDHAPSDISNMIYSFSSHFLSEEDKQEIEKALELNQPLK